MKTEKCATDIKKYCKETLERFEKDKEERRIYEPTDEEIQKGWKEFFKDFSNRDLLKNWTLKETENLVKYFNNENRVTTLIRLFDSKFVNKIKTPIGEYLIEKTKFGPFPSFSITKSETGDHKIDIDNGYIVICKKEMIKYFCCGPLVPIWKVIKAISPVDIKIKKFDSKEHVLKIQILCPNAKTLIA